MHSDYIYLKRIRDEREKLLLLKYANTDITNISEIIKNITVELMDQCYSHIEKFDNISSYRDKKYYQIEELVFEELQDLKYIKKKFIEYFMLPGKKTKEDLFIYVFGYQISANYYNEFLYSTLISFLKKELTIEFWQKYDLSKFEIGTEFLTEFYILRNIDKECSTGRININIDKTVAILDAYFKLKKINNSYKKIETIKEISKMLDNYYNKDFPHLNNPYRDSSQELIDHIKIYKDLEKPTQFLKRI